MHMTSTSLLRDFLHELAVLVALSLVVSCVAVWAMIIKDLLS